MEKYSKGKDKVKIRKTWNRHPQTQVQKNKKKYNRKKFRNSLGDYLPEIKEARGEFGKEFY